MNGATLSLTEVVNLCPDGYRLRVLGALDRDQTDVTLLVGADDDCDVFGAEEGFEHLIERFRNQPA